MRFRQFSEGAMEDTIRIIQKTFSPERKAVSDKILEIVRAVQMGKGDKMELARAITDITKSELQAKNSDPDLKVSTTQNLGMLQRAMDTVTGMSESITEDEIDEYKSMASLRNRSNLDALARLQDRNKKNAPKVIEIPKGTQLELPFKKAVGEADDMPPEGPEATVGDYTSTHLFMCGSAVETVNKHGDKPGMEKLVRLFDMLYKMEHAVEEGQEASDEVKELAKQVYFATMEAAREAGIEGEVAEYQQMHLDAIVKGDPEAGYGRVDESVTQSLTEEQFDEKAGEKDACYRKVKSRYKVWPSAYASGALTKCRKVGAANWGNSKK